MRQFQTQYRNEAAFGEWLDEVRRVCRQTEAMDRTVFYVQTDSREHDRVSPVTALIREKFPAAPYAGASGNGNIMDGVLSSEHITVTASVYEDPQSRVEVLQMPVSYDTQETSARALLKAVQARPWIKAVEMMTSIRDVDMPLFCREISSMPDHIQLFGGSVLARDVHDGISEGPFVFSSAGAPDELAAVFVFHGGPQLHIQTGYVTGWRRLGLPFEVTKAENNVLHTLNGQPAYEVYNHFLQVPDDYDVFSMSVLFPFAFEESGVPYLRVSTTVTDDGSMFLASDIKEHTMGNIAFGDPANILDSIRQSAMAIRDFTPDAIRLYSCASRQLYWGEDTVSRETKPFETIASTSGFYTSGEFLRSNGLVIQHNVTMVTAALREGPVREDRKRPLPIEEGLSRQIMLNNCLTSFINAATEQLNEANERLARMAITDGLTELYNRTEIERRIREAVRLYQSDPEHTAAPVLVMADLDKFKEINDHYGHQEGDQVLRSAAKLFLQTIEESGLEAYVGRWGGEEFMFLVLSADEKRATVLAESIRETFGIYNFPVSGRNTLSTGVAVALPEDTVDSLLSRVDMLLYQAKEKGRNQSVVQ